MDFNNAPVTLFEVSWEVCNKVGGIYSVVSSKALQAVETFGEDYFLLGPSLQQNAGFEETDEHIWDSLRLALSTRDLKCRLGRWNIPGRPKAILVDFSQRYSSNQLLYEMWKNYGVDSLSGGWDYIEPVMFATACGEVIAAIHESLVQPLGGRSVALFHEWMSGAGLLTLKKLAPAVGTVFTTHATMLGRALAGTGRDIYSNLRSINPATEAAAQNITAKWSLESASAREADAFTTVSPITGEESTVFLGRQPDVITVNGLDLRVIPDFSEERENRWPPGPESWRPPTVSCAARCRKIPASSPFPAATRCTTRVSTFFWRPWPARIRIWRARTPPSWFSVWSWAATRASTRRPSPAIPAPRTTASPSSAPTTPGTPRRTPSSTPAAAWA